MISHVATSRAILLVISLLTLLLITAATLPALAGNAATSPQLPPAKQAFIDRMAQWQRDAQPLASLHPKNLDPGSPVVVPSDASVYLEPHFTVGSGTVVKTSYGAPGDTTMVATTLWSRADAPATIYYAGRDIQDSSLGVMLIYDATTKDGRRVTLPGHGTLSISGGTNQSLLITAADGLTFQFDLASGMFSR